MGGLFLPTPFFLTLKTSYVFSRLNTKKFGKVEKFIYLCSMKSLKIDETLHRRIKQQAVENNQSIQEFVDMVFDKHFNECKSRKVEKDTIPIEGVDDIFEKWLDNRYLV